MKILPYRVLFLLLCVFYMSTCNAIRTIQYDRQVIPLDMVVGVEQMIQFSGSATIGWPQALYNDKIFKSLFTTDTAYWRALRPFKKQRVKVRLDDTGEFILFDVSAHVERIPPESIEPLNIVVKRADTQDEEEGILSENKPEVTFFDLIRYAAQTDHAPKRVVAELIGVHPVKKKVRSDISALYNHPDSVNVDMTVRKSWATDGWYVTAIDVRNRTDFLLEIDPSRMQHTRHKVMNGISNQFIATAIINRELGNRGSLDDRTILYVITDRPFASIIDL